MDLKIHVTFHAYAEEELRDEVLVPHSGNYGILGKEIVALLRRINGKSFSIKNVEADFSITNLWDWISYTINIQHLLSLVKLLNPRRIHRNVRL